MTTYVFINTLMAYQRQGARDTLGRAKSDRLSFSFSDIQERCMHACAVQLPASRDQSQSTLLTINCEQQDCEGICFPP